MPDAHNPMEDITNSASEISTRVYLDCPFKRNHEAKALRAMFDKARACWYLAPGSDPAPLSRLQTCLTCDSLVFTDMDQRIYIDVPRKPIGMTTRDPNLNDAIFDAFCKNYYFIGENLSPYAVIPRPMYKGDLCTECLRPPYPRPILAAALPHKRPLTSIEAPVAQPSRTVTE